MTVRAKKKTGARIDLNELESLMVLMRKHGAEYVDTGVVSVSLGKEPAPVVSVAQHPSRMVQEPKPSEETKRDDGLTQAQADELYGTRGGEA